MISHSNQTIPQGLEIFGDFEIKAHVDKTTVHANKPVNLTIEIRGTKGILEGFLKFDLGYFLNCPWSYRIGTPKVYPILGPTQRGFFGGPKGLALCWRG